MARITPEPGTLTFEDVLRRFAEHPEFIGHGFRIGSRRLELLVRSNVLPPASDDADGRWWFDPEQVDDLIFAGFTTITEKALVIRHTYAGHDKTEVRTHLGWNETWTQNKKAEATRQYWPVSDPRDLVEDHALLVATVANFVVGLWEIESLDASESDVQYDETGPYYLDYYGKRRRSFRVAELPDQQRHPSFHKWLPDFGGMLTQRYGY